MPLFGAFGLISQLRSAESARPRKFCNKLYGWLYLIRIMWPECPALIDPDGTALVVGRACAVLSAQIAGECGVGARTGPRQTKLIGLPRRNFRVYSGD